MSAIILGKKDTLDEQVGAFAQAELKHTLFLNSVPKGGTHLIRNIVRMFVPAEQHYQQDFIQIPNLVRHREAFSRERAWLSCGHLLFCDDSVAALGAARHIVLVRDPYDWVLARARFHVSEEFVQPNLRHLKTGVIPVEELLNMAILGIHDKSPSLLDIYTHNAAGWIGTRARMVRYEDLLAAVQSLDTPDAEAFFARLLDDCGLAMPADWRERVAIGADRKQSRTARENLTLQGGLQFPAELPAPQKALVDFAAPGLRALLGYR